MPNYFLRKTGKQIDYILENAITEMPNAVDIETNDGNLQEELNELKSVVSNPNLLDNPWFQVNQRGQGSYSTTNSYIYSLDRWMIYQVTVSNKAEFSNVNSNSTCFQPMVLRSDDLGKQMTMSILLDDGTFYSHTFTVQSGLQTQRFEKVNLTFENPNTIDGSENNKTYVGFVPKVECKYKAVKLEYGSISTLANDNLPDYGTELRKCQRYFFRYNAQLEPIGTYGTAYRNQISLPVTMRKAPIVTSVPISGYAAPTAGYSCGSGFLFYLASAWAISSYTASADL